jgi:PAS domain S-box-containing protein
MEEPVEKSVPGGRATVTGRGPGPLADHKSDIFFAAVETTRMPMTVTDPHQPDNPIIFCNRAFAQMTGYSPDEIVGANCRFLQGPETDQDTLEEVRRAILQQREVAVEILNYRKDGSSFWNALFISPVYSASGELIYFFGSQLDVSRRRDAEDALRQAQKMEALGQLTGGIAHDFNNLLQVIVGYVDSVKAQATRYENARLDRSLDNISEAADRAGALTQQLLAFARKQKLDGRTLNLNNLIAGMGEMVRRTLGQEIDFDLRMQPDLWNCRIDPTQTEVALLNVLINARDAMATGGGRVTIETSNAEVKHEDARTFGDLPAGNYVAIAVTDTGEGMGPDVLNRVMEPFFTTKEVGRGTGLGLAMVYGFAKQSGGAVRIYSEVGHGTTVRLYFPAIEDEDRLLPGAPSPRGDRPGHETVLVVEDRPDVRELARTILEDFGYRVLQAADGREALELLDREDNVDLLFTDLIMPGGINGVMLAREARKRQPRLKVLLTTGYAEASLERTDAGGAEFDVINKPYRRMELARRVRGVLDGASGLD